MRAKRALVFSAIALTGCASAGPERSTEVCVGVPDTAELLAPQLADSGRVFRGVLTGTRERTLYFFKKVSADPNREDYRIYQSRRTRNGWSPPEVVSLGEEASDLYPTLTADGKRMVFASYRGAPGDTAARPNAGLWYADWRGGHWGVPSFIQRLTEPGAYHSHPMFGSDGRLYFGRTSPDWSTSTEYVAPVSPEGFGLPEAFDPVERWRGWRPDLHVWGGTPGHDGSYVLLDISPMDSVTRRPLASDIWVSFQGKTGWTEPRPVRGKVNREGSYDNFPSYSPDGCELLFVRDFTSFYHIGLRAALAAP